MGWFYKNEDIEFLKKSVGEVKVATDDLNAKLASAEAGSKTEEILVGMAAIREIIADLSDRQKAIDDVLNAVLREVSVMSDGYRKAAENDKYETSLIIGDI